jgi:hypothetical protein
MQMQDGELNMLVKTNGMFFFCFLFFVFFLFFADEAKILAYVRDMHGGLYIMRQDKFKPLPYLFLLVIAT